jgi:putative transposase
LTALANAICERFGGSLRRECLDYLIPFHERHLQWILKRWIRHYNEARPHMSLGPGIPAPTRPAPPMATNRHTIAAGHKVKSRAILGGLHQEYWLERVA